MPLGSGAFGEVHLAWDQVDSRWVALKRFTGQDELGLLRMVIESRIRVSHPHLVRTLAFRLVDDRAWLVTELARGGSLRAVTARRGVLPWGWVAEALDQILAALTALHATGVVHRDLKPANLLLRSSGAEPPHLLVADFGIATWRTVSMTGIGAAIGTPGYLAPEYLDGHQPSPATDVFAVGVLAAELLTGRRLVHYSNASPSIPSSWHDVLPVPPDVPRPLAAVIQRMADPNPARRYTDCTQAREALLSAAPPGSRGDLTVVAVPDLLAAVPPGWTPEGPEQPATELVATPEPPLTEPATATPNSQPDTAPQPDPTPQPDLAPQAAPAPQPTTQAEPPPSPNLTGLLIDGGPTGLVLENEATVTAGNAPLATPPLTPASGSPSGSPTQPPSFPATPPNGVSNQPSAGSATPPAALPSGSSTPPATHSSGSSTHPRTKSLTDSSTSPAAKRKARRRRKVKRAFLLIVLLILASGAGTLWWAATHRTIPGQPTALGGSTGEQTTTPWTPEIVESCNRVELGRERAGGTERCQRTENTDPPQHWVKAPPTGFPTSNPKGPFPSEDCDNSGDTEYSPTGDRLTCNGTTWQVRT